MIKLNKVFFYKVIIVTVVFWLADFIFHNLQFTETSLYYISRLASALIFSAIWFLFLESNKHWKRFVYSLVYIIWLGLYFLGQPGEGIARQAIFLDQIVHMFAFYIGLELASLIKTKR